MAIIWQISHNFRHFSSIFGSARFHMIKLCFMVLWQWCARPSFEVNNFITLPGIYLAIRSAPGRSIKYWRLEPKTANLYFFWFHLISLVVTEYLLKVILVQRLVVEASLGPNTANCPMIRTGRCCLSSPPPLPSMNLGGIKNVREGKTWRKRMGGGEYEASGQYFSIC